MNKILFIGFWLVTLVVSYWIGLNSDSDRNQAHGNDLATLSSAKPIDQAEPKPDNLVSQTSLGRPQPDDVSFGGGLSSIDEGIATVDESRTLAERLVSSDPINRLQAFAELLKKPDSSSIDLALQ
ncbi:MAG: hypothetical protein EBY48_10410, partial [Opitutae bacterium]|nr:hypothetical protein [Opitutae bacterium]